MTDTTAFRTALSEGYLGDTKNFHAMFSAPQTLDLRIQTLLSGFAQDSDSATADDLAMPANLRAIAKALSDLTQSDRIALIQALKTARLHDSIAPERGPFTINFSINNNSGFGLSAWIDSPHGSFTPNPGAPLVYLPSLGPSSIDLYCSKPFLIANVYTQAGVVTQRSLFSLLALPAYTGPASTYEDKMLFSQVYLDPRVGVINVEMTDDFSVASVLGDSGAPRGVNLVEMVPAAYGDFDVLHEVNFKFENTSASAVVTKFRFHISPSDGPNIGNISTNQGHTFFYSFTAYPSVLKTANFMLRIKRVAGVVTAGMSLVH